MDVVFKGSEKHFALVLYHLFSAGSDESQWDSMQIQFIVDGYILKGGYCLGSLFFNLSCWSKFDLPFYCFNH